MACFNGCNDCNCVETGVCQETPKVESDLKEKLRVFHDYVCTIAMTPCAQLSKLMAKVVYYIWCFLKDLVNTIINNRKRTETLMENDEYFCGKLADIYDWTNQQQRISEVNNRKLIEFSNEISQLAKDSTKIGFLERPLAQALTLTNEPDAVISKVTGGTKVNDKASLDDFWNVTPGATTSVWSTGNAYFLNKNQPVTVTYENLKNSSVNGVKISKIEYTYTLLRSTIKDGTKIAVGFYNDPTKTINMIDGDGTTLKMEVKFYDERGQSISPKGSVISFSSLNTSNFGNDYEGVSGLSGIEFVKINGSSIDVTNGLAKAKNSTELKSLGSEYDGPEWDVDGSPLEYYGAIAGEVTADAFSFNIETLKRGYVWFAFNSRVKAKTVKQPVLEKLPSLTYECNIKEFEC